MPPLQIRTSRGIYQLKSAANPERSAVATTLTLALDRADGVERVAFRCRIADELIRGIDGVDAIVARLAPWVERHFDQMHELALKTVRSEHRLHEFVLDASDRGPF